MQILNLTRQYSKEDLKLINQIRNLVVKNRNVVGSLGIRNGNIQVYDPDGHPKTESYMAFLLKSKILMSLRCGEGGVERFNLTILNDGKIYE